jgi:hypothetical protein
MQLGQWFDRNDRAVAVEPALSTLRCFELKRLPTGGLMAD